MARKPKTVAKTKDTIPRHYTGGIRSWRPKKAQEETMNSQKYVDCRTLDLAK
jgi:hypothetical protein